jgi:hypothetical protein
LVVEVVEVHTHTHLVNQKVVEMVDHMLAVEMVEIQLMLEVLVHMQQVEEEEDILLEMDMPVVQAS